MTLETRPGDKSPSAFRTISEVAGDLDLPQHVLRFWETKFAQIKPLKRGGGRRFYRPDDIDLLRGIRHLLYGQGYTIRGVQRILKEQGVRAVAAIGRGGAVSGGGEPERGAHPEPAETDADVDGRAADADWEEGEIPSGGAYGLAGAMAPARREILPEDDSPAGSEEPEDLPMVVPPRPAEPAADMPRGGIRLLDRLRGQEGREARPAPPRGIGRDEVRLLQSTLFELLECKRLLDQAR